MACIQTMDLTNPNALPLNRPITLAILCGSQSGNSEI